MTKLVATTVKKNYCNQQHKKAIKKSQISALLVTSLVLGLTIEVFNSPTLAKDTEVNGTLVEPRRIRLPKVATEPSTKDKPNCPCPYDIAFDGKICGRRSAYVKPGENEPACYEGETKARQLWWNSPDNQFVDRKRTGQ